MSKRFGRKQKRKMRDEIKNLECLVASEREKTKAVCNQSAIAGRVIEMIRRINPHFPALENPLGVSQHCWRVEQSRQLMDVPLGLSVNEPILMEYIDLYQLEAELAESDDFMRSVTFSASVVGIHGPPARSCMRASREALKAMGVCEIALNLACHLKSEIEKL